MESADQVCFQDSHIFFAGKVTESGVVGDTGIVDQNINLLAKLLNSGFYQLFAILILRYISLDCKTLYTIALFQCGDNLFSKRF